MTAVKNFFNFWIVIAIVLIVVFATSWLFNVTFHLAFFFWVIATVVTATILHMCDINSGG